MCPRIQIDAEALGLRPDVTEGEIAQALKARFSNNGHSPLPDWRWGGDGLFRRGGKGGEYQVFNTPLHPRQILATPEGHMILDIEFTVAGAKRTAYLDDSWPTKRNADAGGILAQFGVPSNVRELHHLQAFVAEALRAGQFPRSLAYDRLGWHNQVLVAPNLTKDVFITPPGGEWLSGYGQTNGSSDEARQAWANYLSEAPFGAPCVMAGIGAALASPMLSFLPQTEFISFLVHQHTASTATGKTVTLSLGKAAVGSPHRINTAWDGTKVGLETMLGYLRHFPLYLDELGAARLGTPEQFVMMLGEETGRRRGAGGGGLRPTNEWRLISISTGNAPIAQGSMHVSRRILSIPIALPNEKFAEATLHLAHSYYGHPLHWCLPLYKQVSLELIREIAQCYRRLYTGELLQLKAQANYWAVIELGARMLLAALDLPEEWAHISIMKVADESVRRRQAEGVNYLARFIDSILEDMAGDPIGWGINNINNQRPPRGNRGRILEGEENPSRIAVLPGVARELARRDMIPDLTGVLMEARDAGVLQADSGHLTRPVRVGGTLVRCYVMNLEQSSVTAAVTEAVTEAVTPFRASFISNCRHKPCFLTTVSAVTA